MARFTDIPAELHDERRSRAQRYGDLVVGRRGWGNLIRYELVMLVASWVPGGLGLLLRAKLYPLVLGSCGRNVNFGVGVVLRHPHKIHIGNHVIIDDHCVLDAKGRDNRGIVIGDRVFIGRNSILTCKDGDIELEDEVNIGFNCTLFSASTVRVGRATLLAAYCYLVGGGHRFDEIDVPVVRQPRFSEGIEVGPHCWLGTGVKVLDGVSIGRDVVIGANAVVHRDLPDYAVAAGIPAKVLRDRRAAGPEPSARR